MKDFYDIYLMSGLPEFSINAFSRVVRSVFEHRRTAPVTELEYDDPSTEQLNRSWKRFIGALEDEFSENVPADFNEVVVKINALLDQLFERASEPQ